MITRQSPSATWAMTGRDSALPSAGISVWLRSQRNCTSSGLVMSSANTLVPPRPIAPTRIVRHRLVWVSNTSATTGSPST